MRLRASDPALRASDPPLPAQPIHPSPQRHDPFPTRATRVALPRVRIDDRRTSPLRATARRLSLLAPATPRRHHAFRTSLPAGRRFLPRILTRPEGASRTCVGRFGVLCGIRRIRSAYSVAHQPAPGQHETHEPAAPVIVHVHMSTPLYVHVQVVPPHTASQTSPAVSLHVDEQVGIPADPELAVPEHEPLPTGRGMFGQTLLGTVPTRPGLVTVVDTPAPLSSRHAIAACCCESHPKAYCATPMFAHVGCSPSMQRRKAVAAGAHDGDIDAKSEQLIGQLVLSPEEHPAFAILSQTTSRARRRPGLSCRRTRRAVPRQPRISPGPHTRLRTREPRGSR